VLNGLLAVLKIVFGWLTNSFALISDGIDSLIDILTSGITLFTAAISEQPPDVKHPYGHGRAETIATKLLAFVIFFAGSQLIVTAVQRIFDPAEMAVPSQLALYIALISVGGKIFLGLYKRSVGKKYNSSMMLANAKNMRNDVLISASVFTGILFTRIFELPILDTLVAVGIGIYILYSAFQIFTETSQELMDGMADKKMYQLVFEAANSVKAVTNPHKTRIRKLNNMFIIDIDIEVDGQLTVKEGHETAVKVEKKVREKVPDVYDVHVHVEPEGNVEDQEKFGISEELLK